MPEAEDHEPGLFGPLGMHPLGVGALHPMIAFDPALGLYTIRSTDYRLIADEGVLRGQRSHMSLFPVEDMEMWRVDMALQRIPVVDEMRLEILAWFKGLSSGGAD
jgi:hypothetical protein